MTMPPDNVLRVGDTLEFSFELLEEMVIRQFLERQIKTWKANTVPVRVVEIRRHDGKVELVLTMEPQS